MKIFLLLFLLINIAAFSQNADGTKPSFHFSFYGTSGDVEVLTNTGDINERMTFEITPGLSFNAKIKIPFTSTLTISPFVNFRNLEYSVDPRITYKFTSYDYGATLSFYLE